MVLYFAYKLSTLDSLKKLMTFSFEKEKNVITPFNVWLLYFSLLLYAFYGQPCSILRYLMPNILIILAYQGSFHSKWRSGIIIVEALFLIILTLSYLDGNIFIG